MIRRVLVPLTLCIPLAADAQSLSIAVDPRIELISILFHRAGREEYAGRVPRWTAAVDSHFAAFATLPAQRTTDWLAKANRVGYFVPMNLSVHLTPVPDLRERSAFSATTSIHRTWTTIPDSTQAYLGALRSFIGESHFDEFMRAHRALLDSAELRLRRLVMPGVDSAWFNQFWGGVPRARLTVVPALLGGGASYGIEVTPSSGPAEGYAIIGVANVDAQGFPTFDTSYVSTVIHELNHPYVTPIVRAHLPEFRDFADSLLAPVLGKMRAQGYGSWDAVLNESLVRAAAIRYELAHGGRTRAEPSIESQTALGFVWTRGLVDLLGEYESNRSRYASMDAFMPRIVDYFRGVAR